MGKLRLVNERLGFETETPRPRLHPCLLVQWVYEDGHFNGVTEIFQRLALVATVTKIWDSTSNSEILVWSTAKGLDRHRVRQIIGGVVIVIVVYSLCRNRSFHTVHVV